MYSHYSHLPPTAAQPIARTFAILPPPKHVAAPYWFPQDNSISKDEVSAHMGMFNATTNDGFYALGLRVVGDVGARIEEEGVIRRDHIIDDNLGAGAEGTQ